MELIGIAALLVVSLIVALKGLKRRARIKRRLEQCGADVSPEALAQWAENMRAPEPVPVKERKAA